MGVLKREGRRANFRGGMTPYIFILVGSVYLILTPFTDKGLKRDIGQLAKNNKSSYLKFTLVGTKEPFTAQNKKAIVILKKELPNANSVVV